MFPGPMPPMFPQPSPAEVEELQCENANLRARLEQLTRIDLEGGFRNLAEIAGVARRYLPPAHHETAMLLLRLAYIRGQVDVMETTALPLRVVLCPTCKPEGR